jgi:hypothetical protein
MEELKDAMQTDSNRTHLSVVERYYTPRFILGITISQFYEYFGSSPPTLDLWLLTTRHCNEKGLVRCYFHTIYK